MSRCFKEGEFLSEVWAEISPLVEDASYVEKVLDAELVSPELL